MKSDPQHAAFQKLKTENQQLRAEVLRLIKENARLIQANTTLHVTLLNQTH